MTNPVLVRDCRQMVRSRFVVGMIGLFLCGMIFAVYDVFLAEWNTFHETERGRQLFWRILVVTGGGPLLTVLFSSIHRIWTENTEPDPMFISLLTPTQIVMGKLLGGVVVSALFYSMALPFLSLVYLLRGVDILAIAFTLVGSFLLIQSLHAVCLAFFAGAKTLSRFVVMLLLFLPFNGFFCFFACICGGVAWYGIRNTEQFHYAVSALVAWALFFIPITATLLAIAQYSPPSSNRMFATRLFITVCGVLLVPIVAVEHLYHDLLGGYSTMPLIMLLSLGGVVVMVAMNLIAICERDEYTARTRREEPKWLMLRLLKFPLSSGATNAFCWTFLATAFLVLSSLAIVYNFLPSSWQSSHASLPNAVLNFAVFTLFVFNYSATALFVHRFLLFRWIPREWAWTVPLGLLFGVAVGTYLLGLWINPELYRQTDFIRHAEKPAVFQTQLLLAPNPLTVFVDFSGYRYVQVACAFVWAAALGSMLFTWCVIRLAGEEQEYPQFSLLRSEGGSPSP